MLSHQKLSPAGLWILLLGALMASACHKNTPAPPPPAPAPAPAAASNPAPTITLRANPVSVARGDSVTLEWQTSNATSVSIDPGVGTVPASGNRQVSPTSSVTYSATATGPGGSASDTARVTVTAPAPPAETPLPPRNTTNASVDELFASNVQTIYFEYDKAEIRPDQMQRLQGNAAWLKANPNVRFTIEGHCDERGSEEYNLGLGDRRANSVKEYLVAQGIAASRINVVSYGAERPVCKDQNEECYQQNRRAAFSLNP